MVGLVFSSSPWETGGVFWIATTSDVLGVGVASGTVAAPPQPAVSHLLSSIPSAVSPLWMWLPAMALFNSNLGNTME